jgi:acyl carrier protein
MKDRIIGLIQQTADGISDDLVMAMDERGVNTILFGPQGVLDSLGLVNLIVALEAALEDEFGVAVILTDERAMSQTRNPFRTVGALADYALVLIEEEDGNSSK